MEPYLALFEPDREASGYLETFPDFGYGATQGETDHEANGDSPRSPDAYDR
jgi:predicted RNase H-like HicB family nuclease